MSSLALLNDESQAPLNPGLVRLVYGLVMGTIGQRIRRLRLEVFKLTQDRFAERFDVSKTMVSFWEGDKHIPATPVIIKMAQSAGVSTDYILLGEDNVNAAELSLLKELRATIASNLKSPAWDGIERRAAPRPFDGPERRNRP